MYCLYIRVAVSVALSCSSSEQKPSLRQRHRLLASNAESRIRLVVLLTAPKIFAISSHTGKNSCRNFARLSAWCFRLGGTPTPETKTCSERTYKGNVQLKRRNTSRNGGDRIERRTYVTHKPILQRLQQVAIVCLLVFVFLFPHAKNCAFIFLTLAQVRLFLTCGSPCV